MSFPLPGPGTHRQALVSRTAWSKLLKARAASLLVDLVDFAGSRAASCPAALRAPLSPAEWLVLDEETRTRRIRALVKDEVLATMPPRPEPLPDPGHKPKPVPVEEIKEEPTVVEEAVFRPGSMVVACVGCGDFVQVASARARLVRCQPCRRA